MRGLIARGRTVLGRVSPGFLVVCAAVLAFTSWRVGTSEAALSSGYSTANDESSCVAAIEGRDDLTTSMSWNSGEARTFHLRCYWDDDDLNGATRFFPAAGFDYAPTGTTLKACVYMSLGGSNSQVPMIPASLTFSSSNPRTSAFTVDVLGVGFAEWHFTATRGSAAHTIPANPTWIYHTIRPADTCSTTGAYNVGSSSATTRMEWVAWSDWDLPEVPETRYVSAVGDFETVPFCGAEVTVKRGTTVLDGDDEIYNGETLTFSTVWTSGRTAYVRAVFPGNRGAVYSQIFTAGAISNPYVTTVTVNSPPAWDNILMTADMITLECNDEVLAQSFTLLYGQTPSEAGDGRPRPCELARFYWPVQQDASVGQSFTWKYSYSGTPTLDVTDTDITAIEWANFDEAEPVPAFSSLTWNSGATSIALGSTGTITATAGYDGTLRQFVWRCTDELGTIYSGQWASGVRIYGAEPGSDEASCYAQTGIGLSPGSWVPGLVRMGSCVLQSLFVPSDDDVQAIKDAGDAATAKAPISFVAEGVGSAYTVVDGMPAAVDANTSGCWNVLGGDLSAGEVGSVEMCPATVSSNWSTARNVLDVILWAGFAIVMFWAAVRLVS